MPIGIISVFFGTCVLLVQSHNAMYFLTDNPFVVRVLCKAGVQQLFPILGAGAYVSSVGAHIAAELSYMKISNQLQAVDSMGLSSYKIIILPRFTACVIGCLLMVFFCIFVGLFSIYFIGVLQLNFNPGTITYYMKIWLSPKDWIIAAVQSLMFGLTISFFAINESLKVAHKAEEVGYATKIAVVKTMIFGALFSLIIVLLMRNIEFIA